MWLLPLPIFLVLTWVFLSRLHKEYGELGIDDVSQHLVNVGSLCEYVSRKKAKGEPLSLNFYATIVCALGIFSPFVYALVSNMVS